MVLNHSFFNKNKNSSSQHYELLTKNPLTFDIKYINNNLNNNLINKEYPNKINNNINMNINKRNANKWRNISTFIKKTITNKCNNDISHYDNIESISDNNLNQFENKNKSKNDILF